MACFLAGWLLQGIFVGFVGRAWVHRLASDMLLGCQSGVLGLPTDVGVTPQARHWLLAPYPGKQYWQLFLPGVPGRSLLHAP